MELCLLPETLQCTVSLVDRFMANSRQLIISEFQLVGVTSMLIASKFHEIRCPPISDFLRLTEDSFTRPAMLEMETRVLKTVDFAVQETVPLPVTLLENLCAASSDQSLPHDHDSDKLINASYLIDLSLLYAEFLKFSNQDVVLSALRLSGVQHFCPGHRESLEYLKCRKLLQDKASQVPVPAGLQNKYEGMTVLTNQTYLKCNKARNDLVWLVSN